MNHVTGYARPVPMGYWAMLRLDRNSRPSPIMGKGGKPVIYPTEAAALRVVVQHLVSYFTSDLVGWRGGDEPTGADALFPSLEPYVKQRGKTKAVIVERRRATA